MGASRTKQTRMPTQSAKNQSGEDIRMWNGKSEGFSLQAAFRILEGTTASQYNLGSSNFPVKRIWLKEFPIKVSFFMWALLRGRTLMIDSLRKRRKIITNRCVLCKNQEETIHHLFMDCRVTKGIWKELSRSYMNSLVSPIAIND